MQTRTTCIVDIMTKLQPVSSVDDVHRLALMAHAIWNEFFPSIIGQAQVDYMVEKFQSEKALTAQLNEGYTYFFICDDGEKIGYIGLVPRPDKNAIQISKFYLFKDARAKGHGGSVIKEVQQIAASNGVDCLYLTVNKFNDETISAYQKMGFTLSDDIIMDIEGGFIMDDYEMIMTVKDW